MAAACKQLRERKQLSRSFCLPLHHVSSPGDSMAELLPATLLPKRANEPRISFHFN